jgi:hypothetical protein
MVITLSNGKLSASLGTQETKQLMAESATRFFTHDIDAQLEIEQGAAGAVTGILLQQDGEEHRAKRIAERIEVKLPPEVFLRYAGTYQIAPGADVIMTVEDRLMAKPPSDPETGAFASPRTFFKTFNAQLN